MRKWLLIHTPLDPGRWNGAYEAPGCRNFVGHQDQASWLGYHRDDISKYCLPEFRYHIFRLFLCGVLEVSSFHPKDDGYWQLLHSHH